MNFKSFFLKLFFVPIFLINNVSAHCPLCTAGAAVAAGGAIWLGISKVVVSMFIGAFAMSMGMWFSRSLKKKYIPLQNFLLISSIFLATILPILPILNELHPIYISLFGGYGTLFNRTYLLNGSLFGSLLGGLIIFVSPKINLKLKKRKGGYGVPFQGIMISFTLLLISAIILEVIL